MGEHVVTLRIAVFNDHGMFSDERLCDRCHSNDEKMGKQWQNDGAVADFQICPLPNELSVFGFSKIDLPFGISS